MRRPNPPASRLVVERIVGDTAFGWAHDPDGAAELELSLGGERLMHWPRTVQRADVDAAAGAGDAPKGYHVPLGAIATALALTPEADRPPAALTFGQHTYSIDPAPPAAPSTSHLAHIRDAWFSDRNHVRLRLAGPRRAVVVAQPGLASRTEATTAAPDSIVTAPVADPFRPILIGVVTDEGADLGVIAFPSLLRGGLHEAEGFAMSGGDPARLAAYAYELAYALATRPRQRVLVRPCAGIGIEPFHDPALARFLGRHAILREADDSEQALMLTPDEIPTLAALAGGGRGYLATEPPPQAKCVLVDVAGHPALDRFTGPDSVPPRVIAPDTGRPLAIRTARTSRVDIETLLYPEPPQPGDDTALPPTLSVVLTAENTAPLPRLVDGLPEGVPVHDAAAPLPREIAERAGPVLFLNKAIALHDRRTAAMLARIAAVPGIATAGCLIVREAHHGDIDAHQRIVAAGLAAHHAAADQPWRAPLAPLNPWPALWRTAYIAAANHPACVMVAANVLAEHGHGLTRWDALDLLELMRRASAAGLRHAVTTSFSVFDRRNAPNPIPTVAPVPLWPPIATTRIIRLC